MRRLSRSISHSAFAENDRFNNNTSPLSQKKSGWDKRREPPQQKQVTLASQAPQEQREFHHPSENNPLDKLQDTFNIQDEEDSDEEEPEEMEEVLQTKPSLFSQFTKLFTVAEKKPALISKALKHSNDVKSIRKQKYQAALAKRASTIQLTETEIETKKHDADLAAGEEALIRNHEALKAASVSRVQHTGIQKDGMVVSPISQNMERVKAKMDRAAEKVADREAAKEALPARKLSEWFDAGLKRNEDGKLIGKKDPPPGYERSNWASEDVPLLVHKLSGTVIWPVRLDLVPFFQEMERATTGKGNVGPPTTVFHYTTGAGMRQIVRPSDEVEECTVQEPHDWGEEVWDRLEDDVTSKKVGEIADAPEFSIAFTPTEPSRLETKEAILKAVYRTDMPTQAPMTVGHCVAVLVPLKQCVAIAGRLNVHTIIVLPPGEGHSEDDSVDDMHLPDHKKKKKNQFTSWTMRSKFARAEAAQAGLTEKVQRLALLDSIVERDSGKVVLSHDMADDGAEELESKHLQISVFQKKDQRIHGRKKNHMELLDEQEEALVQKYEELQQRKLEIERKIRHAENAQKKLEAGKQVRLLLADQDRLDKLKRSLASYISQIRAVKEELEECNAAHLIAAEEDDEQIIIGGGNVEGNGDNTPAATTPADGTGIPTAKKTRRKRRVKNAKKSEFTAEIRDSIYEVAEEYNAMSGDIFRDVFGGNIAGVAAFLRSNGDPNETNSTTGWTPLIMATSAGDPDMVQLLLEQGADPRVGSKNEGLTPMHLAVGRTSLDMARTILRASDHVVKDRTIDGSTPLLFAIMRAPVKIREDMVKILVEATSDANAMNRDGWTPLSWAVFNNFRGVVKMLISNRGNVLEDCPETEPKQTIWQVAMRFPGLQQLIKTKLSSRDMHLIEKRFPGSLGKDRRKNDDD